MPSLLLAFVLFQSVAPAPTDELQRGKNAYDRGEFARAIEVVRPLLYPEIALQTDAQIVQAHRILGVSYLFEKQPSEAAHEFRKLLQILPDYHFDPLLDPPEVVDFFNTIRSEYEAEISQLEAKRREMVKAKQRDQEECEKVRGGPAVIEKKVGRNSYIVNYMPFGAGQFQNGHRTKVYAFLIAASTLGAVSIGAFATNLALYGFRPQRGCRYDMGNAACPPYAIDRTDENRSRWISRVQIASGAMFFGAVLWGVLDALYYYQPETQLSANSDVRQARRERSLRLAPVVMNRAIGPGLSFRF